MNPDLSEQTDLHEIFRLWEQKYTAANFDPEPYVRRYFLKSFSLIYRDLQQLMLLLFRLAEIFEEETEEYMQKGRDFFNNVCLSLLCFN